MLMRGTPEGTYLVALRNEQRLVEVNPSGEMLHLFSTPDMPVMAQRLADGSTIGSGRFGLVKLDGAWKNTWSFTSGDAAPYFPLLITWGITELPDHRLVGANSAWHLAKKDETAFNSSRLTRQSRFPGPCLLLPSRIENAAN